MLESGPKGHGEGVERRSDPKIEWRVIVGDMREIYLTAPGPDARGGLVFGSQTFTALFPEFILLCAFILCPLTTSSDYLAASQRDGLGVP